MDDFTRNFLYFAIGFLGGMLFALVRLQSSLT